MKKITLFLAGMIPAILLGQSSEPHPVQKGDTAKSDSIMKKDTLLKEVIVTHRKPLLTHSIDRTIVNVDAMISAATSNALEVLGKTPGVTVDNQGTISLNGQSGVLVLINNRPTYLSAQDLAGYLRSLPGSSIDKIELIDSPPARYDASGNAVINLQLKRSSVLGINGQVSTGYTQGIYARTNHGLNLTYYTPRLRWYNNLGLNTETGYSKDHSLRQYLDDTETPVEIQLMKNSTRSNRTNYSLQSGLDYTLNARTTLGAGVRYSGGGNKDRIHFMLEKQASVFHQDQDRGQLGLNLNFLTKLNNAGREWSGELNYVNNSTTHGQEMIDFDLHIPATMKVLTFNTDYVHPLGKKARFEAGFKLGFVESTNQYEYLNRMGSQPGTPEKQLFPFDFKEAIQAAYISGQKKWNRIGIQAGLRAEYTANNGEGQTVTGNVGTLKSFKNDYLSLFPSIHISYQLDSAGNNTLVLFANRRINRPNYQLMNPFILYADRYNYNEGNPQLQPQYMKRYEIRYMRKHWLQVLLSYSDFSDVIFPVAQVQDTVVIRRSENVARGQMVILTTNINRPLTKWWNTNTQIQWLHAWLEGKAGHPGIDAAATILRADWRNDFNFSKTWQAELGGYYTSKNINVQSYTKSIFRMYAGVQKKVLQSRGSIRLSVEDIFRSWVYRNTSFGLDKLIIQQRLYGDTQRFGLAFTYSFGKKGLPKKSRNLEQAGEERNRL